MAEVDLKEYERKMDSAIESLKKDLSGLRTGRASASLLEPIMVEIYGSRVPLTQAATISVPESRMLTVQVWDKGAVKSVEKAIRDSGLGLNPQNDGQMIRVPLPDLSAERRIELVKIAGKYAEDSRIAVRNVRRDAMDLIKKKQKDSVISEDEQKRLADEVQKLTDAHIKRVDETFAAKEKEIKQV